MPMYTFYEVLAATVIASSVLSFFGAVAVATAMQAIHARVEITRMKRVLDRLVWPMGKEEFAEIQLTYSAFTDKVYGDSRNFMSHREATTVSPAFKAKLEKRLGITV